MKDSISIQRVNLLHPKIVTDFTNFITDTEDGLGIVIRIVQGLRTFEQQGAIYAQGRTMPGNIVTWAKAGQSYHNYGLAVDIVPLLDNGASLDWKFDFSKLLPFAEKYSITWGGNFPKGKKDMDHFEKTFGYSWSDLLAKYNAKDFITGTTFINI
jgi:peptidoglycan L-alanyl-D-glutamate endopeptidase CwlK